MALRVLIEWPAFRDYREARAYPVLIPPAPALLHRLPYRAVIQVCTSGACRIEVDD